MTLTKKITSALAGLAMLVETEACDLRKGAEEMLRNAKNCPEKYILSKEKEFYGTTSEYSSIPNELNHDIIYLKTKNRKDDFGRIDLIVRDEFLAVVLSAKSSSQVMYIFFDKNNMPLLDVKTYNKNSGASLCKTSLDGDYTAYLSNILAVRDAAKSGKVIEVYLPKIEKVSKK